MYKRQVVCSQGCKDAHLSLMQPRTLSVLRRRWARDLRTLTTGVVLEMGLKGCIHYTLYIMSIMKVGEMFSRVLHPECVKFEACKSTHIVLVHPSSSKFIQARPSSFKLYQAHSYSYGSDTIPTVARRSSSFER